MAILFFRKWLTLTALVFLAVALLRLVSAPAFAQADLSGLSPQQRSAVEAMMAQGLKPRIADGTGESGRRVGSDILLPPDSVRPRGTDDIVPVNLVPLDGPNATSAYVTFGQAFAAGALRVGQGLSLRVEEQLYPVQVDVKARHEDGSVRHAVLSADIGGLPQGRAWQGMLVRSAPAAPVPVTGDGSDLIVDIAGSRVGALAGSEDFAGRMRISQMAAAGMGEPWLSGPLVREVTLVRQIGPLLKVRADHRVHADGSTRTRIVFENHGVFQPGSHEIAYHAIVWNGEQVVTQADDVAHYRGSNWSQIVRTGPSPAFAVQLDPAYLSYARAILPYDLDTGISAGGIRADLSALSQTGGRLSPGLLNQYMPSPGGRPEIGPLPAWDVAWLKSQDPAARAVMLAMADISGAVPWHFEDSETGAPVRIDRRPAFWADERGMEARYGRDRIPSGYFSGADGGWTTDTAHRPLLSYTAYLATGDAYYARELAHEGAFAVAKVWPHLRRDDAWVAEELQLRARAWTLRDVSAAAWLLPDSDPLKDYFQKARDGTLGYLADSYLRERRMRAAGETEGWFEDTSYGIAGGVTPWQNDYMVIVLALEALRGSPEAAALVQWSENYHTGRFLDTGAGVELGAAYVHMLTDPADWQPVGSWRAMVQATAHNSDYTENYPDYGSGYVTSAYAALVMIHRVTRSQRSLDALNALYGTQTGSRLFDSGNEDSVHHLPGFLLSLPTPESP